MHFFLSETQLKTSVYVLSFFLSYSVSSDTAAKAGIQSNCVTDYIFVSFLVALQICFYFIQQPVNLIF